MADPTEPLVRFDEHAVMLAPDVIEAVAKGLQEVVVSGDDRSIQIEFGNGVRFVDRFELAFVVGIPELLLGDIGSEFHHLERLAIASELLIARRPRHRHWTLRLPIPEARWHGVVVGSTGLLASEHIAGRGRHGSSAAELTPTAPGAANVLAEKMRAAARQLDTPPPDPWRKPLENVVKGVEAMSTVALLDVVGARHTTCYARRLAAIMRELKFIPIQSRRLMPGGYRDTVTRGWARPLRPPMRARDD